MPLHHPLRPAALHVDAPVAGRKRLPLDIAVHLLTIDEEGNLFAHRLRRERIVTCYADAGAMKGEECARGTICQSDTTRIALPIDPESVCRICRRIRPHRQSNLTVPIQPE